MWCERGRQASSLSVLLPSELRTVFHSQLRLLVFACAACAAFCTLLSVCVRKAGLDVCVLCGALYIVTSLSIRCPRDEVRDSESAACPAQQSIANTLVSVLLQFIYHQPYTTSRKERLRLLVAFIHQHSHLFMHYHSAALICSCIHCRFGLGLVRCSRAYCARTKCMCYSCCWHECSDE